MFFDKRARMYNACGEILLFISLGRGLASWHCPYSSNATTAICSKNSQTHPTLHFAPPEETKFELREHCEDMNTQRPVRREWRVRMTVGVMATIPYVAAKLFVSHPRRSDQRINRFGRLATPRESTDGSKRGLRKGARCFHEP